MRRAALIALAAATFLLASCLVASLAWTRYTASLGPLDLSASREGSTIVVDRDGRLLRPFTLPDGRWRLPATTHDVDPRYVAMLGAYEDGRFYQHDGVDLRALVRAGAQWLIRGHVVSGGSTLPMQVARLIEPRPERTIGAKLRQIARALEIERDVGKAGVLDRYLTIAPFGGNLEGVRAAALAYFGKEPLTLTLAEAALLVALPQSPEARRPDHSAAKARAARDRVLDRIAARGLISASDAAAAKREPVPQARLAFQALAAHAAEEAVAADRQAKVIKLSIDARLQAKLETLAKRASRVSGLSCPGRSSLSTTRAARFAPASARRITTMPRATVRSTCRARPAHQARRSSPSSMRWRSSRASLIRRRGCSTGRCATGLTHRRISISATRAR